MAGVWIWKDRIAWERGKGKDGGFEEDAKGGSSVRLCAAARARPTAIAPPQKMGFGLFSRASQKLRLRPTDCADRTRSRDPAALLLVVLVPVSRWRHGQNRLLAAHFADF